MMRGLGVRQLHFWPVASSTTIRCKVLTASMASSLVVGMIEGLPGVYDVSR